MFCRLPLLGCSLSLSWVDRNVPLSCCTLCCCDKPMTKSSLQRKCFILSNTFTSQPIIEGSQGRNSRQEAEHLKECCLLACFLVSCCATLLIPPGTTCSGVAPSPIIPNPENTTCLPVSQSDGKILSVEVLSSQTNLVSVKLTVIIISIISCSGTTHLVANAPPSVCLFYGSSG